jgi:uncharacterized surface anchored protein
MLILSFALILSGTAAPIANATATAQDSGTTIYLELQDGSTGDALTDSCFVLENASNEGCDENGDGRIRFEDIAPDTYTVRQTRASEGFLPIGDFTINVNSEEREQSFFVATFPDTAATSTADVALALVDAESGDPVRDGCFIFEGGSKEGCDENGDGVVTFDDMPVGAYRVRNTVTPDGYEPAPERWIGVNSDKTFTIELAAASAGEDPAIPDIALITREPENGELLPGSCYILVGFSNEGCDEDGDGRVTFEDVPAGTYEVEQTAAPADETRIDKFMIEVMGEADEQGIVVKQAKTQTDEGHRHVSVLYQDPYTGDLVRNRDTCVRLTNAGYESAEACDENMDGQVDFLDVPLGTYDVELEVANRPAGSDLVYGPMTIEVTATEASAILVLSTLRIA